MASEQTILLATSCLQGLPLGQVIEELYEVLENAGFDESGWNLQYCPGNLPDPTFSGGDLYRDGKVRLHHTFHPAFRKGVGWHRDASALIFKPIHLKGIDRVVHPPFRREGTIWEAVDFLSRAASSSKAYGARYGLELPMHGEYTGATFRECMSVVAGSDIPFAIDVSHLHICSKAWLVGEVTRFQKAVEEESVRLLEVHVSDNNGARDQHRALTPETYGLQWARALATAAKAPIVLECYMHRMTLEERVRQVRIALGES